MICSLLFLTTIISGNIEITASFLQEIDRLVQLLESPIFTCMLILQEESIVGV